VGAATSAGFALTAFLAVAFLTTTFFAANRGTGFLIGLQSRGAGIDATISYAPEDCGVL
jgi:hypothetical protein